MALMYRSTVMLNCLANGIPMVMPGWIDYGWNDDLGELTNCYVAQDFRDLEARLWSWIEQPPPDSEEKNNHFLRPSGTGRKEFTSIIGSLIGS
jgi:hypothetical protein